MKQCQICGREIINGQNGCAMMAECSDCRPVRYYAPPRKMEPSGDYENLILARQEEITD